MGSTFNGLVGLIILALDIWAIINVFKSGASTGAKVLWILLIPSLVLTALSCMPLRGYSTLHPFLTIRLSLTPPSSSWRCFARSRRFTEIWCGSSVRELGERTSLERV